MSGRKRWDDKHRESEFLGEPSPFLLACLPELPRGRALDVACGLGRNALALAAAGYEVDALDWSFAAARKLLAAARISRCPGRVRPLVCDLTRYPLPRDRYDVVLCVRFLDRSLWPSLEGALAPGGALLVETFNIRKRQRDPDFPREYCLAVGELRTAFPTLTLARYRELPSESTASWLGYRESRGVPRGAAAGS